jgi:hypothetical protein
MSEPTSIYAQFTLEPVHMPFKSEEAGRPIYEDREFVRIVIAGDKNSEVYREVTEGDRDRFHEVYDRFKRGLRDRDQIIGTPLKEWAALRPAQIKEFEAMDIHTIEHLAAASDTVKQKIGMGAHQIVAKAQAYLDSAKGGAAAEKYAAENIRLREDIDMLKAQIAEISARQATVSQGSTGKRGPGRPPKVAEEIAA